VYTRSAGGVWSFQQRLKASNAGTGDEFGWSVSLDADGNTLAVGARNEKSGIVGNEGDNTSFGDLGTGAGAVYVFTSDGATWTQKDYVKSNNPEFGPGFGNQFGQSVSLNADGDMLAVGARFEDGDATGIGGIVLDLVTDSGAVYIFNLEVDDTWTQNTYIKASNTSASDAFGQVVSLGTRANGDVILAVGAFHEASGASGIDGNQSDDTVTDAGAVYAFTRDVGTGVWSQNNYIKASNTGISDRFGITLDLSTDGNTLAVGSYREDGIASDSGAVYVFSHNGTDWSQQGSLIKASNAESSDEFGRSVSLSANGDTLAVGAHFEDSNTTGIAGAENNESASESGAVYTYTRSGSNWSQQTYVKASNTDAGDAFGWSVSLTADGNTLAVGAKLEDSKATGVGGTVTGTQTDNSTSEAGAVYLY
jgi:hypothetical protein